MKRTLGGKTAIVTGASRGIGRAIAGELARRGTRCVLAARTAADLESAACQIRQEGGEAVFIPLDLRVAEAPARLVEFALQQFGRIDILVNNAGATRRGRFLELTEDDWADGFALKFLGAVRLCRAAWPHLKSAGGSVLNIAGIGGRTPGAAFSIGGAVNAALVSFTKSLAETGLEDGVQVNAINPGSIRTDRLRKRLEALARQKGIGPAEAERSFVEAEKVTRIGEPEDIAQLAAFVVGPEGRFLHGAAIDMDGGATKTL